MERVPAWWINHRSRPAITRTTFRNWVEESFCRYSLHRCSRIYVYIFVRRKFLLSSRILVKDDLREEYIAKEGTFRKILKMADRLQFRHTPAISHLRNNLRPFWYSPPFRTDLSMPQDSPPPYWRINSIWGHLQERDLSCFSWLTFQPFKNNRILSISYELSRNCKENLVSVNPCMKNVSCFINFLRILKQKIIFINISRIFLHLYAHTNHNYWLKIVSTRAIDRKKLSNLIDRKLDGKKNSPCRENEPLSMIRVLSNRSVQTGIGRKPIRDRFFLESRHAVIAVQFHGWTPGREIKSRE